MIFTIGQNPLAKAGSQGLEAWEGCDLRRLVKAIQANSRDSGIYEGMTRDAYNAAKGPRPFITAAMDGNGRGKENWVSTDLAFIDIDSAEYDTRERVEALLTSRGWAWVSWYTTGDDMVFADGSSKGECFRVLVPMPACGDYAEAKARRLGVLYWLAAQLDLPVGKESVVDTSAANPTMIMYLPDQHGDLRFSRGRELSMFVIESYIPVVTAAGREHSTEQEQRWEEVDLDEISTCIDIMIDNGIADEQFRGGKLESVMGALIDLDGLPGNEEFAINEFIRLAESSTVYSFEEWEAAADNDYGVGFYDEWGKHGGLNITYKSLMNYVRDWFPNDDRVRDMRRDYAMRKDAAQVEADFAQYAAPLPTDPAAAQRILDAGERQAVALELDWDEEYVGKGKEAKRLNTAHNFNNLLTVTGITACLNEMSGSVEIMLPTGQFITQADIYLSHLKSAAELERLPATLVETHLYNIASKYSYHPVRKLMHQGVWDGVDRVGPVIRAIKCEDPDTAFKVIRTWLIAAVASLYVEPGTFECKLVPVLLGEQNNLKSAFLSRLSGLVPNAFHDELVEPNDKDSLMRTVERWVCEFSEMESLSKRDIGTFKSFVTRKIDRFRRPYGKGMIDKPRQTVFFGTANGDEIFTDQTGNARFAAIMTTDVIDMDTVNKTLGYTYNNGRIKRVNPECLRQFWLQVKSWFDAGESWHLAKDVFKAVQAQNTVFTKTLPYEEVITEFLAAHADCGTTWTHSTNIAQALNVSVDKVRDVGRTLTALCKRGLIKKRMGRCKKHEYEWPLKHSRAKPED